MSAVGIVSLILVALMLINSIDRTLNGIWQDTSIAQFFVICGRGEIGEDEFFQCPGYFVKDRKGGENRKHHHN